ncbi:MAG TPA: MarC family protein [Rhabdochlamydiaceae bacterium]|jgi:MarC family membrane protein
MSNVWHMLSMALALFLLMDSIGNVPLFIALLKNIPAKRQRKIIFRELVIALLIILLFWVLGAPLLFFLNIEMPTILIAGGIILFLIAIKMIFPTRKISKTEAPREKEPFIVPLATPLVAGPAVLAAVMLYSGQRENAWVSISAIILAWVASTLILLCSPLLKKMLGDKGLTALERLMGLVLTLLAVQMFLDGVLRFMNKE